MKGLPGTPRYLVMTTGSELCLSHRVLILMRCTLGLLLLASLSVLATDRVDCGCAKTGGYIDPLTGAEPAVIPTSYNTGISPGGVYRVTVTAQYPVNYVTVNRVSTGALLLQQTTPTPVAWGFSPDDDRFVLQYPTGPNGSLHNVFLYNLAGSTPNQAIKSFAQSIGSARTIFSPSRRFFLYAAITAPAHALLNIVEASSGTLAFQSEFTFSSAPGSSEDNYGSVGWGFSPDSYDRTFVYAWVSGANSVQFNMVNLEKNLATGTSAAEVHDETILDISAFWQFSPCGDLLGLARQPNLSQARVDLWRTIDGTRVASPYQDFAFAAVAMRSTAFSQIANVGGTDYLMATNSASASCTFTPPTNDPPVAAFTIPPLIRQYVDVTFTDQSTDSDGDVVLRLWNFGDGTTSSEQNPTHNYSSAGTFNVRLQVMDDQGQLDTVVRRVTVLSNSPPHASFTFTPTNPVARDIVTFTDTSTDDDGIRGRFWSLGSTDPVVQRKVCGSIDVSLTVYDRAGQYDTITQTIPVSAPPNPVIVVPPGGDLAAAVALTCPGDVIQLAAGTYVGGIHLVDLTLRGIGAGQTIVSGVGTNENRGRVIWSDPSRYFTNTISDLTITGGREDGCGLYVGQYGGGLTHGLSLNISGNTGFGGIYTYGNNSVLELRYSTVVSNVNTRGFGAGGITIDCCGKGIIKDSEIAFNISTNAENERIVAGGIADLEGERVLLVGNYVHHNLTSGNGGGLSLGSWGGQDLVANNRFVDNSAASGGGVFVWGGEGIIFGGNLVARNLGGGIADNSYPSPGNPSPLLLFNSTVADNIGPGLVTGNQGTNLFLGAAIFNSIIAGNTTNVVGSPSSNSSHSLIGSAPAFQAIDDYHLPPGSGAIDAGDNGLIPQASSLPDLLALEPDLTTILGHDIDGDPRIVDGDHDGTATVEIGYDEFAAALLSLHIERSGTDVVLSWTPPDAILQEASTLNGTWQDASPHPASPYTLHSPSNARFYRLWR